MSVSVSVSTRVLIEYTQSPHVAVDTGDTQAAPEKVKAQSRWAQLRVKHVDEVVAKKRKDLMKGFTEFQEHMRDWPAFVVKVRTCGGGAVVRFAGTPFIHSFVPLVCVYNQYCDYSTAMSMRVSPFCHHPTTQLAL